MKLKNYEKMIINREKYGTGNSFMHIRVHICMALMSAGLFIFSGTVLLGITTSILRTIAFTMYAYGMESFAAGANGLANFLQHINLPIMILLVTVYPIWFLRRINKLEKVVLERAREQGLL